MADIPEDIMAVADTVVAGISYSMPDPAADRLSIAEAIFAERDRLSPAPQHQMVASTFAPTHRHKKRGSTYQVIAHGHLQVDGDLDMEKVTIYQAEDGSWWVRPDYEFEDGRFEFINPFVGEESGKRLTLRKPATSDGSRKWSSEFPPSCCTAWEDCEHDGICHDRQQCKAIGPNDTTATEGSGE